MYETKPWLQFYGDTPHALDYPRVTMYESLIKTVEKYPNSIAYDFLGYTSTYKKFAEEIDHFADALASLGLKKGDRVTISMPTSPQGVICFYAVNRLGAVASMIHPLSTVSEIEFYVNLSKSKVALTIDAFYGKFKEVIEKTNLETVILTKIPDYLGLLKKAGFKLTTGRKIPKVPQDPNVRWWKDLMNASYPKTPKADMDTDDMAVILYSGGTTGTPKGIMLSNMNFVSEGMQCAEWAKLDNTDAVLAILPIFHGFGLGVCVNGAFMGGCKSILVPQFTPESVAQLIKKKKPSVIIGVPTLYEALNKNPVFQKTNLSCLKAAFSGADTLPRVVKERFEGIVQQQGGYVKLLEGYGLTEAVTGIMATPMNEYREGSIGIPFPDMLAKIVKMDTTKEADLLEEGEICIKGPAVMLGYLDNPEETTEVLKKHDDGEIWLHTGDIGTMDKDGFFYFKLRQKRMIKSSGMNVYPAQVEDQIYKHAEVAEACVIGVPDQEQVQKVKAYVVLKDPAKACAELQKDIIGHCRKELIKWSCPREIEFRDELPKTLVGKVAFKALEDEEVARLKSEGKYAG
ncbi:MAG: long-chain fatty acid--CoA ligase [bacterium]|nr:long-chain fatty acid--CoA ligase [bacterium]